MKNGLAMLASLLIGIALAYGVWIVVRPEAAPAPPKVKESPRLGQKLASRNPPPATPGYELLEWEALVPKDWDPTGAIKQLDLSNLQDEDPRAIAALKTLRESWDKAPIEPSWNGKRVRVAGYLVPLDGDREQILEFLLVPYFGACIHTPPPPANQTIHVVPAKPLRGLGVMDPVWVEGVLKTVRSRAEVATGVGVSGYRIDAERVSAYTP